MAQLLQPVACPHPELGFAPPALEAAFVEVPILRKLRDHASADLSCAVVETSRLREARTWPYRALLANVEENGKTIAAFLGENAHFTGGNVAYLINPGMAYIVAELAIWAAGGVCVPLCVLSPLSELEYVCCDSEARLLVCDAANEEKARGLARKVGAHVTMFSETRVPGFPAGFALNEEQGLRKQWHHPAPSFSSSALILYTSGTTGKPKGVVHTHSSLTAQFESLRQAWQVSPADRVLHVLPLHHIHGVQNVLNTSLHCGSCVEFAPFDAELVLDRLGSGQVTCFHAVPTIYVKLLQFMEMTDAANRSRIMKGLRQEALRLMVSGSAALPFPTMKAWAEVSGHVLLERYGMTEVGMPLSNCLESRRFPGCVGWPLAGVFTKVDADGGLLVKGDLLFKEYWRLEDETQSAFTADGWFITGDNCQVGGTEEEIQTIKNNAMEAERATGRTRTSFRDSQPVGTIYRLQGRTSVDIIKTGGYKVSALEVESVFLEHPHIKECAVIGKPDKTWGERLTLVGALSDDLTLQELRSWGRERLAPYKLPQELIRVEAIPRNTMGKVNKKEVIRTLGGVS